MPLFCLSGFSKTAYYSYSTNGGNTWSSWISCYCTGSDGSNSFETIIAYNVPFNQDSADQNKIKFKIKDIAGNVGYSNESTVKIDSTPPYTTYTLSGERAIMDGI